MARSVLVPRKPDSDGDVELMSIYSPMVQAYARIVGTTPLEALYMLRGLQERDDTQLLAEPTRAKKVTYHVV